MSVLVETSLGPLTIDVDAGAGARRCAENFVKLCKCKYYHGTLFHRVERGFVAQAGDPTGTGRGGDSVYARLYGPQARFFHADPPLAGAEDASSPAATTHARRGTVSMVGAGRGLAASQFLITLSEAPSLRALDREHAVFGRVVEGLDTLDRIGAVRTDDAGSPLRTIRIFHTHVLVDPWDDPPGLDPPDRSPTSMRPIPGRLEFDESFADSDSCSESSSSVELAREALSHAEVLRMVGDLPEVDVRPPDSVLFVCKLNPVTASDDLASIFAQFGRVRHCEVVRDAASGRSLGYGFVEFDDAAAAERAYFKMDNVVVDDRRIRVDFSQSVSQLRRKYGVQETGFFGARYRDYLLQLRSRLTGTGLDTAEIDRRMRDEQDGAPAAAPQRKRPRVPER